ncbi:MAG: NAD(P)(+) transhydrogenase (Re/Si-specific) subunit beta, partial [Candidatus Thioglobus sp.]|nr:NAD(P)(+) transhydrogenase (Re/Si-specific) subunit beta [Candidatus Thioglobus sp.]
MEMGFTSSVYLVAAVLFILSLGGLSGQESAKRAVWYGITGMVLAVSATLLGPRLGLWWLSLTLIAAGGLIGYLLASKVEMTQMPELVAGMHALVGLAAVIVGFNTHFELVNIALMDDAAKRTLEGFSALLAKKSDIEISILSVETSLGIWIGAITFTGSVTAYSKLSGKATSKATKLPGGHYLNATAAILSVLSVLWYLNTGELLPMIILMIMALFIGYHLIMGIGGADMPVVVSML